MPVYAVTIFIGAFLLFQVQPLIGKYILPWFGGAPGVWTTCMLFFQVLLLGGYAYAHFSSSRFKPRVQVIVHLVLLAAALTLPPITPADSWKPVNADNPTWRILGLLVVSIGLPYLILSSTGPLLQHWFSRTHPGVSPFRLYALSNVGSLLALISFPVVFETQFTRSAQATFWGWGLALYAIACACCAVKFWRAPLTQSPPPAGEAAPRDAGPTWERRILWLLLPAFGSVLLLATTNKICQEVAVIPFLWILPLSLYLLSFIICFDSPRWYVRFPFALALLAAWWAIAWALWKGPTTSIPIQAGIYSAGLFICCMICHGELYRLKPDPRHLTGFYLMISAGGALGGLFVAVIAPVIFNDYLELQWGLVLCGALFLFICARDRAAGSDPGVWKPFAPIVRHQRLVLCICLAAGLAAFAASVWRQSQKFAQTKVYKSRNFYGVLTLLKHDKETPEVHRIELAHGQISHGMQYLDPRRAKWPTLYFTEHSGIGRALRALPAGQRRIGVIGLGAGTLAAYPQAGDYLRMYEINPEVERLARSPFTFLTNCPGRVEVVLGDARLSLEREAPQNFDLFAIDAFNSDAIPVHLLTREAFEIYQRHLKTNGVLAVHVTNRGLNLEPVVINLARHFGYQAVTIDYWPPENKPWVYKSVWMLLSRNAEFLAAPDIRDAARPPRIKTARIPLWTDDFASLFQVLHAERAAPMETPDTRRRIDAAVRLYEQGDFAGGIAGFREALRKQPDVPGLLNALAFALATCPDARHRSPTEAVALAERACEVTRYQKARYVGTLAAVYSEAGRFADATAMAQKACVLASESGEESFRQQTEKLLELYRAGRPFREFTRAAPPAADSPAL